MGGPVLEVVFDGLHEFVRDLRDYTRRVEQAVEAALYIEGEQLIADSKPLVPVDEGTLRSSGHAQLPEKDSAGDIVVEVGYGGPAGSGNQGNETNSEDVGYAVYVHEDMSAHHTVGQAKYLEQPFNERKKGYSERIAARIRKRLKR